MNGNVLLYSFGYWGWGNSTRVLIESMDAIERSRGFAEPFFVDIRFHRKVRSIGFHEDAFDKTTGGKRYQWMKRLGNASVNLSGSQMHIADPAAAEDLLDLALKNSNERRNTIFFCACPTPMLDGTISCHRYEVASLILKAAKKNGVQLKIVEWPGDDPSELDIELPSKAFQAVLKGKTRHFPIGIEAVDDVISVAGLPWCSLINLFIENHEPLLPVLSGPGIFRKDGWRLPVIFSDPDLNYEQLVRKAHEIRAATGFLPRYS